MRSLVRVELTRFRCRRAILLLAAAGILLGALFAARLAWDTRPYSAEELATATAQAEMGAQDQQVQDELATCRDNPHEYLGPSATAAQCDQTVLPSRASFLERGPLDVGNVLPDQGVALAILLVALLVVAGTTFAGADWASGSMSNQLLFEARRPRVWTAKALALALGSSVVALLGLAAFWVPVWLVAGHRNIPVSDTLLAHVGWHLLRTVALAMATAVLAYALTMLFRHTVATIALLFGTSVAAEILLSLLPFSGSGRISPSHNAFAWLLGRTQYFDPSIRCPGGGCDQLRTLQMWPAGLLIGGTLVAVVLVSLASFRRRDLP